MAQHGPTKAPLIFLGLGLDIQLPAVSAGVLSVDLTATETGPTADPSFRVIVDTIELFLRVHLQVHLSFLDY